MYFPKGFDLNRAIETGELILQAYDQFEAYKNGKAWKLENGYRLITELCYREGTEKSEGKGNNFFDFDFLNLSTKGKQKAKEVPIGFIASRKRNFFLIFRGTSTDMEWVRNFMINLVPYSQPDFGKVHNGFLMTYKMFQQIIEDTLAGSRRGSRLFIAGHSLGGALATIALPDVELRLKRKVNGLYTYGSPRIGDDAFVTAYNRLFAPKSFRVVNTEDLVGSIPPPVPIAGGIGGYFSHVDTPIDCTIQDEGTEKNHNIKTYLGALKSAKAKKRFLANLRLWYN